MPTVESPTGIFVQSIFGAFERKPFVQITVRDHGEVHNLLVSPAEARDVASSLLECAEAAEMDAIVIKFVTEKLGIEFDPAVNILMEFRKLREGE